MSEEVNKNRSKSEFGFFNTAIEYLEDRFTPAECTSDSLNELSHECDDLDHKNQLRNEMLAELENLKELLISHSNLDVKSLPEDERKNFRRFINFYSRCPLCGNYNHYFNLKRLYFSEEHHILKEKLTKFINLGIENKKVSDIHVGVPCCMCYKRFFGD
ncbi:MAG: hypothetical protein EU521_00630 [Promethearchaeota archaeon]|nr:MAG: hypothetical protein EU521_00630 [Candidatus Lokiarchaeota archaeon]